MKKFYLLAIAVLLAIFCFGCASSGSSTTGSSGTGISSSLIIAPDPNNPLTGTWLSPDSNYMHVIDGKNGTFYTRASSAPWKKETAYTVEINGYEYKTSNNWRMAVDGNVLTVESEVFQFFDRITK